MNSDFASDRVVGGERLNAAGSSLRSPATAGVTLIRAGEHLSASSNRESNVDGASVSTQGLSENNTHSETTPPPIGFCIPPPSQILPKTHRLYAASQTTPPVRGPVPSSLIAGAPWQASRPTLRPHIIQSPESKAESSVTNEAAARALAARILAQQMGKSNSSTAHIPAAPGKTIPPAPKYNIFRRADNDSLKKEAAAKAFEARMLAERAKLKSSNAHGSPAPPVPFGKSSPPAPKYNIVRVPATKSDDSVTKETAASALVARIFAQRIETPISPTDDDISPVFNRLPSSCAPDASGKTSLTAPTYHCVRVPETRADGAVTKEAAANALAARVFAQRRGKSILPPAPQILPGAEHPPSSRASVASGKTSLSAPQYHSARVSGSTADDSVTKEAVVKALVAKLLAERTSESKISPDRSDVPHVSPFQQSNNSNGSVTKSAIAEALAARIFAQRMGSSSHDSSTDGGDLISSVRERLKRKHSEECDPFDFPSRSHKTPTDPFRSSSWSHNDPSGALEDYSPGSSFKGSSSIRTQASDMIKRMLIANRSSDIDCDLDGSSLDGTALDGAPMDDTPLDGMPLDDILIDDAPFPKQFHDTKLEPSFEDMFTSNLFRRHIDSEPSSEDMLISSRFRRIDNKPSERVPSHGWFPNDGSTASNVSSQLDDKDPTEWAENTFGEEQSLTTGADSKHSSSRGWFFDSGGSAVDVTDPAEWAGNPYGAGGDRSSTASANNKSSRAWFRSGDSALHNNVTQFGANNPNNSELRITVGANEKRSVTFGANGTRSRGWLLDGASVASNANSQFDDGNDHVEAAENSSGAGKEQSSNIDKRSSRGLFLNRCSDASDLKFDCNDPVEAAWNSYGASKEQSSTNGTPRGWFLNSGSAMSNVRLDGDDPTEAAAGNLYGAGKESSIRGADCMPRGWFLNSGSVRSNSYSQLDANDPFEKADDAFGAGKEQSTRGSDGTPRGWYLNGGSVASDFKFHSNDPAQAAVGAFGAGNEQSSTAGADGSNDVTDYVDYLFFHDDDCQTKEPSISTAFQIRQEGQIKQTNRDDDCPTKESCISAAFQIGQEGHIKQTNKFIDPVLLQYVCATLGMLSPAEIERRRRLPPLEIEDSDDISCLGGFAALSPFFDGGGDGAAPGDVQMSSTERLIRKAVINDPWAQLLIIAPSQLVQRLWIAPPPIICSAVKEVVQQELVASVAAQETVPPPNICSPVDDATVAAQQELVASILNISVEQMHALRKTKQCIQIPRYRFHEIELFCGCMTLQELANTFHHTGEKHHTHNGEKSHTHTGEKPCTAMSRNECLELQRAMLQNVWAQLLVVRPHDVVEKLWTTVPIAIQFIQAEVPSRASEETDWLGCTLEKDFVEDSELERLSSGVDDDELCDAFHAWGEAKLSHEELMRSGGYHEIRGNQASVRTKELMRSGGCHEIRGNQATVRTKVDCALKSYMMLRSTKQAVRQFRTFAARLHEEHRLFELGCANEIEPVAAKFDKALRLAMATMADGVVGSEASGIGGSSAEVRATIARVNAVVRRIAAKFGPRSTVDVPFLSAHRVPPGKSQYSVVWDNFDFATLVASELQMSRKAIAAQRSRAPVSGVADAFGDDFKLLRIEHICACVDPAVRATGAATPWQRAEISRLCADNEWTMLLIYAPIDLVRMIWIAIPPRLADAPELTEEERQALKLECSAVEEDAMMRYAASCVSMPQTAVQQARYLPVTDIIDFSRIEVLSSSVKSLRKMSGTFQLNVNISNRPTDEEIERFRRAVAAHPQAQLLIAHPPEIVARIWREIPSRISKATVESLDRWRLDRIGQ